MALTGANVNQFSCALQNRCQPNNNYTHSQPPVETESLYCNGLPENAATATKIKQDQKRCFSAEEIKGMIVDYTKNHLTVYQLAEKYGCHRTTVSKHLSKHGVEVTTVRMDSGQIAKAATLYESGLSLKKVGKQMGVHEATIRRVLIKAGIAMRPARRYPSKCKLDY